MNRLLYTTFNQKRKASSRSTSADPSSKSNIRSLSQNTKTPSSTPFKKNNKTSTYHISNSSPFTNTPMRSYKNNKNKENYSNLYHCGSFDKRRMHTYDNSQVLVCAHSLYPQNSLCCAYNILEHKNTINNICCPEVPIKNYGNINQPIKQNEQIPYEYYFFRKKTKPQINKKNHMEDVNLEDFGSTQKNFRKKSTKQSGKRRVNQNRKIFMKQDNYTNSYTNTIESNVLIDEGEKNKVDSIFLQSTKNNLTGEALYTQDAFFNENKESNLKSDFSENSEGNLNIRNNPEVFEEMYRNKIEKQKNEDSLLENVIIKERLRRLNNGQKKRSLQKSNRNNYISNKTIYKNLSKSKGPSNRKKAQVNWNLQKQSDYSYINLNKISANLNYFYGSFQKFESPKFTFQGGNNPSIHRDAEVFTHANDPFSLRGMLASPPTRENNKWEAQNSQQKPSYFSQRQEKARRKMHVLEK